MRAEFGEFASGAWVGYGLCLHFIKLLLVHLSINGCARFRSATLTALTAPSACISPLQVPTTSIPLAFPDPTPAQLTRVSE